MENNTNTDNAAVNNSNGGEEKKIQILIVSDKRMKTKTVQDECNNRPTRMHGLKLRSSVDQRIVQKRQSRVIRMLFVVVIEFFVCWTPLHLINTIALFDPNTIYRSLGYTWISAFQLL
ncbi:Cholecystokinin receptor-like protein, partial [Dinothrombium tinctorium]